MPLERVRILSVLVISAAIAAMLSGDLGLPLFAMLVLSAVPLWFDINLKAIREHPLWKIYGLSTFGLVVALFLLKFPIKVSVFLLVLFCLIYEFYGERRTEAPTRLVALLSFLILLYQARIESGLNLMLGVLLYLGSVVWCLYAMHAAKVHGYGFRKLVRLSFWPSLRITAVVVVLGMLVFWSLPRLPDQSLNAIRGLNASRLSGFTDRVTLNDIGSLKLSRKHVMDLKPLSGRLHTRYLKGKVLDKYQNGVWSSSVYSLYFPHKKPGKVYKMGDTDEQAYEYQVDMEAMHGNTLFFTDKLLEIQGINQPIKVLGYHDHLSVPPFSVPLALSYTFKASDESPRLARNIPAFTYLEMAPSLSYFKDVSDTLVQEGDDVPQKVKALHDYLKNTFRYTLQINNQGSQDPLKSFLLERKEGHCELFASAMVMLCRSQDIPARLVTGFYIPDPHPSGQFHYITESDAHAWVEVLYEDHWMTVDPTPTANLSTPGIGEVYLAYARHFWRTKIMTWNYKSQMSALEGIRGIGSAITITFKRHYLTIPLGIILIALLIFVLRNRPRNRLHQLKRQLRRLEARLAQLYFPRDNRGFTHWLGQLPLEVGLRAEIEHFMDDYYRFRFGREASPELGPLLVLRCKALLKSLKQQPT